MEEMDGGGLYAFMSLSGSGEVHLWITASPFPHYLYHIYTMDLFLPATLFRFFPQRVRSYFLTLEKKIAPRTPVAAARRKGQTKVPVRSARYPPRVGAKIRAMP